MARTSTMSDYMTRLAGCPEVNFQKPPDAPKHLHMMSKFRVTPFFVNGKLSVGRAQRQVHSAAQSKQQLTNSCFHGSIGPYWWAVAHRGRAPDLRKIRGVCVAARGPANQEALLEQLAFLEQEAPQEEKVVPDQEVLSSQGPSCLFPKEKVLSQQEALPKQETPQKQKALQKRKATPKQEALLKQEAPPEEKAVPKQEALLVQGPSCRFPKENLKALSQQEAVPKEEALLVQGPSCRFPKESLKALSQQEGLPKQEVPQKQKAIRKQKALPKQEATPKEKALPKQKGLPKQRALFKLEALPKEEALHVQNVLRKQKAFRKQKALSKQEAPPAGTLQTLQQVLLYDDSSPPYELKSARHEALTLDSTLTSELSVVFYYAFENDAFALQESVRSRLEGILDPSSYEIEHAVSASSVIYLYILRQVDDCNIKRLMDAIAGASGCRPTVEEQPTITLSSEGQAYAATKEGPGGLWTLSRISKAPFIDLVFYYYALVGLDSDRGADDDTGFLVAHGYNIQCPDLKLKWRAKGLGARPYDVDLIHEGTMKEAGVYHLVQEPESLAMLLPEYLAESIYLECWLGSVSIGGRVAINPFEWRYRAGAPLTHPKKWKCDVFISHSGAEKDLANTLDRAIRDIGLQPFFDIKDLKGTMGNDTIMDEAAMAAPVGVLLLSPSFFERKWPLRELANIVKADTHLPVWIGSQFLEMEAYLKERPSKEHLSELSAVEWKELVNKLKYTTTIVQGSQFTVSLIDTIVFAIVMRSHRLCEKLGNQDRYNSMQLQRFRDRVLRAAEAIANHRLGSLPSEDVRLAISWRDSLRVMNGYD